MRNESIPFFESINGWHKALRTGLVASHDDFHIFRYENVMKDLVVETPHYRDVFFHITLATSMDAVLTVNDRQYDCKRGGLFFFIAPEQLIHWKRGNETWRGFVMLMKPKFLTYSIQGSQILKDLDLFHKTGIHAFQLDKTTETDGILLLEKIMHEYQNDQALKFEMIRSYLKILLIQIQRLYQSQRAASGGNRKEELLYNFQNLVDRFFKEKRSVYEYAQQLNINENYLNEVVKQQTGKTAGSVIRDRMLLEARCMLLHTNLDVSEIAYELQFEEPSNFMRFFKTYEKLTPTAFRKAANLIH